MPNRESAFQNPVIFRFLKISPNRACSGSFAAVFFVTGLLPTTCSRISSNPSGPFFMISVMVLALFEANASNNSLTKVFLSSRGIFSTHSSMMRLMFFERGSFSGTVSNSFPFTPHESSSCCMTEVSSEATILVSGNSGENSFPITENSGMTQVVFARIRSNADRSKISSQKPGPSKS